MSKSVVTVARPVESGSTHALVDASLAWFEQSVQDESADATMAFFTLEPRAQFIALDVMRSSMRAALEIGEIEPSAFGAASGAHYRSWLASDHGA